MDLDRFRRRTAWHQYVNERRYDAPADPWEHVHVDPTTVENYCSLRLDAGLGRVRGGTWDRETSPLRETATYRGLVQRFEEGLDWEETAIYARAKAHFEDCACQFRGYESLRAFREKRLQYVDDLHDSIASDGYRSNASATHDNPHAETNEVEGAYANRLDPMVAIGRDGEICWVEGYHRLIIARLLGVESIPVYVLCRHLRWQATRDRALTGSSGSPGPHDHPDLQNAP